jgi:hypothetical protein
MLNYSSGEGGNDLELELFIRCWYEKILKFVCHFLALFLVLLSFILQRLSGNPVTGKPLIYAPDGLLSCWFAREAERHRSFSTERCRGVEDRFQFEFLYLDFQNRFTEKQ